MTEIVRHKKTSGLYEVLFRGARVRTDNPLTDYDLVQVVQNKETSEIFACAPGHALSSELIILAATVQTGRWLRNGDEVVVYRPPDRTLVWVRPTSEMDDGRFEPADVPQLPSSTPGEAERLVDALVEAARRRGSGALVGGDEADIAFGKIEDAARTALLSHISTAGRGEGAGDLAALSKKATQGEWGTFVNRLVGDQDEDGWSTIAETPAPASPTGSARRRQWEDDAAFIAALVNAFRSGRLVERSATNPQDQE